jgi:two-component system sensor histidine kinase PilS (NtrC family)
MNAGVLLGQREAFYTASLCGILYGAIVDFQYFGLLESIGLYQADARQFGGSHLFYMIFLNIMGFLLTAFITGYLAERAKETEAALREKVINLEELAQLNSMIVSNIETGLITTNTCGKIRVFNPYAESLTGISQIDAYDSPIGSIFPELSDSNRIMEDTVADEFCFTTVEGRKVILGYSTIPFFDSHGAAAGAIINFRDMTVIRRMEEALNRADRMAALGELSARMAHEIRNPLAAMSGSVQVLAEQSVLPDSDRRLLAIVVRESDRLNKLITEFLAYARPSSPNKVLLDLNTLVGEVCLLLSADGRFSSVEIVNTIPADFMIHADTGQFSQVMINLLQNSADAMPDGGLIEIDARYLHEGCEGFDTTPAVKITVTDSGTGIDPEAAMHLFEPFWSSKVEGTGLGLAIIYRIIESHGGMIAFDTPQTGGCRFSIMLPV